MGALDGGQHRVVGELVRVVQRQLPSIRLAAHRRLGAAAARRGRRIGGSSAAASDVPVAVPVSAANNQATGPGGLLDLAAMWQAGLVDGHMVLGTGAGRDPARGNGHNWLSSSGGRTQAGSGRRRGGNQQLPPLPVTGTSGRVRGRRWGRGIAARHRGRGHPDTVVRVVVLVVRMLELVGQVVVVVAGPRLAGDRHRLRWRWLLLVLVADGGHRWLRFWWCGGAGSGGSGGGGTGTAASGGGGGVRISRRRRRGRHEWWWW